MESKVKPSSKDSLIYSQRKGVEIRNDPNSLLHNNVHLVPQIYRIARDSDDHDDHDSHDDDHHDDDHHDDHENDVNQKLEINDDHDDHDHDAHNDDDHSEHDHDNHDDHAGESKKTWTTAEKWGYATLANAFLGSDHAYV